jgi:HPt (histidine-containing phosphotransfer) domain-containing protein
MLNIDALKEFGADVEDGLTRCFGSEEFYLKLVAMITEEKSFGLLKEALEQHDLDAAFEAAHALKGVTANLSLTPILNPAMEITEHLRLREEMDYEPLLKEILEQKETLDKIVKE